MKNRKSTLITVFFLILSMTACKKEDDPVVEPDTPAKQSDQSGSTEIDEALDNVNDIINNKIGDGSNHRLAAYNLPCGVVGVDSTTMTGGNKIYKLYYGGDKCGYKYKSGFISFNLENGSTFNQAGAIFVITFNTYKVEVNATGSVVILNGTMRVTNTSGGYIWEAVTSNATIIHKVRGSLDITYANSAVRNRKYFQQRTWSSSNSWAGLTLTIAGDTTINSVTGISESGKTYDGNYDFQTQIITDFVWFNTLTTWAGPYVLKAGHAKMDVTIPLISPTYIDVEAGYYWNYSSSSSLPALVNDNTSNAYKITTVIGVNSATTYQLY